MAQILAAGLRPALVSTLSHELTGASVALATDANSMGEELARTPADLVILDHDFAAPDTVDLLARWRVDFPDLPVIYCLDPGAEGKLVRRLIRELGVEELLFHPLEGDSLARCAASILGLPSPDGPSPAPAPAAATEAQSPLDRRLGAAWSRAQSGILDRLEVLDHASAALLAGTLGPDLRRQAGSEAHKLAGSLGTFGLAAGSRFAREIERFLAAPPLSSEVQALRLSELVVALRVEVERAAKSRLTAQLMPPPGGPRPALVVGDDGELMARLSEEAIARAWQWESAPDVAAARGLVGELNPSVVLLDLENGAASAGMLELLSDLGTRKPPVPAMILTAGGGLGDRVEVARRGGRGFLPKGLPPGEIVEAVSGLLERSQASQAKVLAVDDDPAVLQALEALLAPQGIRLTGLADPLRFWDVLEGSPPDLLILDIQMPSVNGFELCRVVRNDPRWAGIPVIFLTAYNDPATIHRAFASGADDFVAKPIIGPELITRITNRLDRTRLLRNLAETDPLSGLANGLKSRRALEDFLHLSARHGQPLGFAMLQIDKLKNINEEHGQAAGDEVLRSLGRRLREAFHSEDVTGRWGGNNFVVGMYGLDRPASIRRLEEVLGEFRHNRFLDPSGQEFQVTLSGGVAAYPEDGSDLDGLHHAASEARREASAAGGDRLAGSAFEAEGERRPRLTDVAVVSGDEAMASLLLDALQSEGYRARAIRNGLIAARTLAGPDRSLRARVLVLDMDLPGLDGLTLLRQLASGGVLEDTRAIVLSTPSVGRDAAVALELGAEDHVAKPFDIPALVERIRQALESPRFHPAEWVPAGSGVKPEVRH
jgi:diguanylate cyclase (GGDEF)-like protein